MQKYRGHLERHHIKAHVIEASRLSMRYRYCYCTHESIATRSRQTSSREDRVRSEPYFLPTVHRIDLCCSCWPTQRGMGAAEIPRLRLRTCIFIPLAIRSTLLSSAITTIPAGQISTTYVQLSKHLCCGWKCEWQSCCLSAFSLGSWRLVVQKYCFVQFSFHLVQ